MDAERDDSTRHERLCWTIVANSADPIALLDRDGVIRFVTHSIQRLTGFDAADLMGRHAFEQVHPDDQRRVTDAWFDALAHPGVPVVVEYRARHRDGSWRDREVVGVNRLDDPDVRAIIINYRDTAARQRVEAALEESERLHRSTFDQAPIGVAHTSLSGQFLRVNRCVCDLLGYSADELTRMDFVAITNPDDLQQDLAAMHRLVSGEIDRYSHEKRYRRRDGTFVLVNLTVSVHRSAQGDPVFFIAVVEDLTERKQLEQQLRQAHKMEAIGRLAGGIAHDFNNLLTAIGGYAELAIRQLPDQRFTSVCKDLEDVRRACVTAASLTRQLLAFSRRQVLQPQILDLNVVVHRMHQLLRRLIGEHIEIVWRLSEPIDRINADPGQIEQVVLNLALNARDAMPTGGSLTLETANVFINGAPHVMLAITDTGAGIDDSIRDHLFEPFYTSKEPGQGTGLGLATVYGIVKQSGGSIAVESEQGRGARFKVFLPSVAQRRETLEEVASAPQLLTGSETILVVEDQREVRSVSCNILRRHGYAVIEAADGQEALAVAMSHPTIHLLLTDVVLPGMSGPALAGQFHQRWPDASVLFMSGYAADASGTSGIVDPPAPLIQKPFSVEALLRRVRELIDRPQSRSDNNELNRNDDPEGP